jgi:hypothetical protein
MGFSALGLALSLAIFAPSLSLAWFPPRPAVPAGVAPRPVTVLERAGQALCVTIPAITVGASVSWWRFPLVGALVLAYWALWVRFLATGRPLAALFGPVWGVPVPMALLPVAAFLAGAAWLENPWVAIAAAVLAAGHIPSSLITARAR